ncbi:putative leucine-rich repeat receptor-like serine/threonine-protein kinase At2g19230 [Prosopis cineraria]|uniref:putative leucine-rich repeat receptor-like serine/threonine-protein kinase At2g19230 n=1 Tax=Prosopis cineraria TaxID=364024 RepID=UPI00241062F1|nr:putative leucine-rich repeat receptor-like serine/threonine-protein kinase At2g19230 [Prosopis cineraria]
MRRTRIWYQTDSNFTETGTNFKVSLSTNRDFDTFGGLLIWLRSFLEGRRNCYNLKRKQGKNNTYKDDIYDRMWRQINVKSWHPFNSSVDIHTQGINDSYKLPAAQGYVRFNISATLESDAPPILIAFEAFKLISPLPSRRTSKMEFERKQIDRKHDYVILTTYRVRVIVSIKQDLSYNDLSGSLPEFLAYLPKLKLLNLTGNKLTGSIPKALKEKSDVNLRLSLFDNPGLCLADSCKKKKFVIPLTASISVLIVILLVSPVVWIVKMKNLKVKITDNFQNLIGEGEFGKVYSGTLTNSTRIAVKVLSQSSMQGYMEFRSEVKLLMVVHHRHLVSLMGYCEEGIVRALIYEYMANGNLQQHLSDKKPNVLKWNERLQIALDGAQGLDYLHNGCKPPIVHRDLKTSNILLNENIQAKISDFGLSRAYVNDIDTYMSTHPVGTLGYVDPE